MVSDMGSDGTEVFAIEIFDSLFPVSIAILRPLKGKLRDPPGLAELRRGS